MNLYFLPPGGSDLKDHVFDPWPDEHEGGVFNIPIWQLFRKACERRGITVHTSDFWSPSTARRDDILFVHMHPGETFLWRLWYRLKQWRSRGGFILARRRFLYKNYPRFAKRILFHIESPVATPSTYKNIAAIKESGVYTKIMLTARPPEGSYEYFNFYLYRPKNIVSPYFHEPKRRHLVMINANTTPHSLVSELYGERWRAIRYFHDKPDFDLYGYRWDTLPRHPKYIFYGKYARAAWRGTVSNKLKKLAEYKFCLCFENCSYPGYVSEKLFDCLAAGCIPVYAGAPDVTALVPERCFIDFKKFASYDDLYRFLSSMSEEELARRRTDILQFLNDDSTMGGLDALVEKLIA